MHQNLITTPQNRKQAFTETRGKMTNKLDKKQIIIFNFTIHFFHHCHCSGQYNH